MPILNKDMTLCISLAARPSNIGTRFHNYLYDALELNYVYKAFAPVDLAQAVAGIRGLGIRGAAVSMPYKEDVIELIDVMDASASAIDSVNTIVNNDGVLTAYNTDYLAIARLLSVNAVDPATTVLLRGSGGMAKAVAAAMHDAGFASVTIVARNEERGRVLAALYDFAWLPEVGEATAGMLINVTPLGMTGADASVQSFSDETVAQAQIVFDVVALPSETPLIRAGRATGKQLITGAEVIAIQAEEQFVLYTGVRPSPELVREASEFSRA
ncbi:shikimate 5-dehydrogenase [Arthrobacter psychrolactophilus]|uniref:Shikimate 5-dehydrogenase n=1 Tax=Arthrobacter psychrolactophilus TaxID=92442 RepID=A0A2V5J5L2_9MICC|nr:shikimate 5-dehydrogenase [Arthrobacter psychrolactophilus]PYI37820.1 shikimate 5-dehydrogenase [Arthrobacter psychrolactophilus]